MRRVSHSRAMPAAFVTCWFNWWHCASVRVRIRIVPVHWKWNFCIGKLHWEWQLEWEWGMALELELELLSCAVSLRFRQQETYDCCEIAAGAESRAAQRDAQIAVRCLFRACANAASAAQSLLLWFCLQTLPLSKVSIKAQDNKKKQVSKRSSRRRRWLLEALLNLSLSLSV